MDRLTEKPFRIDSEYCYEQALDESDCKFYKFVSEVEDFLEQQGVNNLEELKEQIIENNEKFIGVLNRSCRFEFEYRKLKNNWDMLKRFAEQFKEYDPIEANVVWKIAEKMTELEVGDIDVGDTKDGE